MSWRGPRWRAGRIDTRLKFQGGSGGDKECGDDRPSCYFTLDGKVVSAPPGETIWQVAQREGIDIPHLCWLPEPGYRADGNCRACMVEIEGERVLGRVLHPQAGPDMVVKTATDRAVKARRMVMELLLADQPPHEDSPDRVSPFWHWAEVAAHRDFAVPGPWHPQPDLSHPAMAVNLSTPASIAGYACAPAARFRSMT